MTTPAFIWRRSPAALLAMQPQDGEELRGQPFTGDVPAPVQELCARLVAVGGRHVCFPFSHEPDLDLLLARGAAMPATPCVMERGKPSGCHENSARSWVAHARSRALITGYALSDDGMWRQHSWCRDGAGCIIETTEARLAYYGVVLTPDEALVFVSNVLEL